MRRPPFAAVLVALVLALLVPVTPSYAARAGGSISGWTKAPSSVKAGTPYVARVTVSGGARAVQLQRRVGTSWRTVATTRSTGAGVATLRWKAPAKPTSLALRVRAPRAGDLPELTTGARVVRVKLNVAGTVQDALTPLLQSVLTLVNQARAAGQTCGGVAYPAKPALTADVKLGKAAASFATLMATEDFFSHDSPNGDGPGDRITAAGYRWRSYGENIAAGFTSASDVVDGWLKSEGHCRNLMGDFTEIGLGYAYDADSTYGSYWVQDFATPQS